jgi:hypothetical protein
MPAQAEVPAISMSTLKLWALGAILRLLLVPLTGIPPVFGAVRAKMPLLLAELG